MHQCAPIAIGVALLTLALDAPARKPAPYPGKGQSKQQDLTPCYEAYGACMTGRGYTVN